MELIHKIMVIAYIIGITHYYGSSNYAVLGLDPFRSFYQSDISQDYSIDFFYAFNN